MSTDPRVTGPARASDAFVTVVMPFFNAERFLREAVDSVLGQTYPAWELLLVDDGSTDGSTAIARHYAERYPGRIRWLEHRGHQQRGASAARNAGIRLAAGEYIALLDADDVWLPGTLEQQVSMLSTCPAAGMVYGKAEHWFSWAGNRYWYNWPGKPKRSQRDHVRALGIPSGTVVAPPALLTLYLRRRAAVPCTSTVLARRAVVEATSGFEEDFRDQFTDQVFFAKMIVAAPVLVVDACWAKYRQHPDSSCYRAKREGRARAARLTYLNWLTGYLAQHQVQDPQLLAALAHEVWLHRHPTWQAATERAQGWWRRWHRIWRRVSDARPWASPAPEGAGPPVRRSAAPPEPGRAEGEAP